MSLLPYDAVRMRRKRMWTIAAAMLMLIILVCLALCLHGLVGHLVRSAAWLARVLFR